MRRFLIYLKLQICKLSALIVHRNHLTFINSQKWGVSVDCNLFQLVANQLCQILDELLAGYAVLIIAAKL